MRARSVCALLLILTALAPAASAAAAEPETNECANLANCTSIANTPWVVVPAAKDGTTESGQGVIEAGTTLWRIDCPSGRVPAGRDYLLAHAEEPVIVSALIPPFNIGLTGPSAANFFAFWQGREATSFQPLVGCVPKAGSTARAGTTSKLRLRTSKHDLQPSQTKTFVQRCAKGERLVGSAHGLAFYKQSPPSKRELRQLSVTRSEKGGKVTVRVRTGADDGDNEQLTLQVHAICRATG